MTEYRSPLLDWADAVEVGAPDTGVAWHYGHPLAEQRAAATGAGLFDESHRDVLVVSGQDRLSWLHAICSQHIESLTDGQSAQALVLSPHGHVEQHWTVTELDGQVWLETEPGAAEDVLAYLLKMRFMKRVEPVVVTADYAVLSVLGPATLTVLAAAGLPMPEESAVRIDEGFIRLRDSAGTGDADGHSVSLIIARNSLSDMAIRLRDAGAKPIGTWAAAALRIERLQPRLGLDTDHRTLVHEVGWIPSAVHLDKGCYRGQETVARVQNLGQPPRRLVLLYLSGSTEALPAPGSVLSLDGRTVGFVGTAVVHYELGPIALAIIKRTVPDGTELELNDEKVVVASGLAAQPRIAR